uniref:Uncharacterized protein n=1 Tax=viral metagenome TaxID=1070528 RepID=A0A6C0L1I0_9ZZZZ|tara:strand:- start:862 stop:1101 length:240 start_codon:yes stop_codon:yes gene_type:complete
MKPHLVEYKVNVVPRITKKEPEIVIHSNSTPLFINLFLLLIIISGIYTLYIRWKNKKMNQKKYEENILTLNAKINLKES